MDCDNPALKFDGTLKDASKIEFFNSPSDKQPLARPTTTDQDSDSGNSGTDSEVSEPKPRGLKGKKSANIVAVTHMITFSGFTHPFWGLAIFLKKQFIGKFTDPGPPKSQKRAASSVNA
ncbi:hypothetical protein BYT27DRAFT_7297011 [Phlegmacium glaucopus]|nr:hypothetical protein BYT27DRAFT_7297011 [Phlegmacium glaucopus]